MPKSELSKIKKEVKILSTFIKSDKEGLNFNQELKVKSKQK